ncbi:Acyl carrier protein [Pseudomonas syringae pv. actinidiae]|uniref:Acyl carrier protein n=1 Tax=Pseudomonas syringae pv. actinidiae TaxID=103796 RepID=A0AAN4TKC4_PSESF|nr:Acyl carrier protein [Pseudomonas syringae pv. actinidiae]
MRFGLVNEVRLLNLTRSTSGAFKNREAIKQKVFDALGIILVDKSVIDEGATFSELFLEDEDVESLFTSLKEAFGLTFPRPIKQQAIDNAREFSLHMIVELVVMMGKETLSKEGKGEKRNR